jgi:hypothetical protein
LYDAPFIPLIGQAVCTLPIAKRAVACLHARGLARRKTYDLIHDPLAC